MEHQKYIKMNHKINMRLRGIRCFIWPNTNTVLRSRLTQGISPQPEMILFQTPAKTQAFLSSDTVDIEQCKSFLQLILTLLTKTHLDHWDYLLVYLNIIHLLRFSNYNTKLLNITYIYLILNICNQKSSDQSHAASLISQSNSKDI